ncbi:head-tail adaptor protein [Pseudomonas tolaasii]|uniref:Head-tail adaptor protein n=1 Tax=Pseudomonas tolaasii TaxID=29442 RepID=A0A7Y8DTG4_PSETO|nr:head-tail adaptor protein [Pseudomonas tolaasii]NWC24077.1 head-tail adaptor protein [Pseudomonas tolaasii]NWD38194.1 head-tail adaptor protein [Pseudomonas tolaasii]
MRAGPMRHRCTMFKPVLTKTKSGGFDTTWVEIGKLWAEITMPTGRIAPIAEKLTALITAEIRIRPREDVVAGNRLVETVKGITTTYLIGAVLIDNENTMLRLPCSNVPNP